MNLAEYKKLPLFNWEKHHLRAGIYRCNDSVKKIQAGTINEISPEDERCDRILGFVRKVIIEVTVRYDGHFSIKSYTEMLR